MRSFQLGLAVLLLLAGGASAQERPSTQQMSCGQTASLVQARGEVVLTTGTYAYERIVRDGGLCSREEDTAPAYVPSADQRQCFVGYRCKQRNFGEGRVGD